MTEGASWFSFLKERAERKNDIREEIWIRIREYRIRLLFCGLRPTAVMLLNLKLLLTGPDTCAEETVYIFEDDLELLTECCMIPEEERVIRYHQTPEYHVYLPGSGKRLSARDDRARETFVCFPQGSGFPQAYENKPFVNEMQWWVMDRYLLMHGAAVARGENAVLITAPTGQGKSTLALACLLAGMQYIAEDYVLLSREGPVTGHPVYCTGNLTEESLRLMPELREHILLFDEAREKYLLDLTSYLCRFRDGSRIRCILYPYLCKAETPSILPAASIHPFVKALTAAAKQIRSRSYTSDSFQILFRRLKELSGFEMRLTEDPRRNARAVTEFLAGEQDSF